MDPSLIPLIGRLTTPSHARIAGQNASRLNKRFHQLLTHRKLPNEAWSPAEIEFFLRLLASLDTNNFDINVGVGEREGRVISPQVSAAHYHMTHGVGRSGNLTAPQPKAAGSSTVGTLAHALALDALRVAGAPSLAAAAVLPLCTGMSIHLTLCHIRTSRPDATVVIMPRIDQKACVKAVALAGYKLVTVACGPHSADAIAAAVADVGPSAVAAIVIVTSCFAPRTPDDVVAAGRVAAANDVPLVVNNAYGVASRVIMRAIDAASRSHIETAAATARVAREESQRQRQPQKESPETTSAPKRARRSPPPSPPCRVDYIICSVDKNLCAPVGGAIVASPCAERVAALVAAYPGRASGTPACDVLVTLLSLGRTGWEGLISDRVAVHAALLHVMSAFAARVGGAVVGMGGPVARDGDADARPASPDTPAADGAATGPDAIAIGSALAPATATGAARARRQQQRCVNDISIAVALPQSVCTKTATLLGGALYARGVSGPRVVADPAASTAASTGPMDTFGDHGWFKRIANDTSVRAGVRCELQDGTIVAPHHAYLAAAAAVGMRLEEVEEFAARLNRVWDELVAAPQTRTVDD